MAMSHTESPTHTFRTTILTAGKTATGIRIPDSIVAALGAGKRPPVRVMINRYTYRSTVAVMGGKYLVGVSAEVREAAGVAGGDTVDVTLALDAEPRRVDVPPALQRALKARPKADARFKEMSYSRQRALVDPIARAKTPETEDRNVAKALAALTAKH
jgi:hypothetical protein